MRIEEAIAMADKLKSNEINEDIKLNVLNHVEGRVAVESGEEPGTYVRKVSLSAELSLPSPYSRVYVLALLAMISLALGEYEFYKSFTEQCEDILHDYAKYCVRSR